MKLLNLCFLLSSLLALTLAEAYHDGGSCGTNSIPYKMEVDSEGKPVISCEAPSCFGISSSPSSRPRELSVSCDPFKEVVCVDELQWTSGLVEINNGTHRTLKTECCSYEGMTTAKNVKSIFLGPGQSYVGGLVEKDGEESGFDLIKEIRKTVNADNQVQYIVGVYRMACNAPSDSSEELPVLSRNKRKLRERKYDDYEEDRRYRVGRRRPFAMRRRALLQRLEDYYDDYDYDYKIVRRPFRKSRLPYNENALWPLQYSAPQRHRTFAENTYNEKSVESGPLPPPPSSNYIDSQNIAPASSVVQSPAYPANSQMPQPPPSDSYTGTYQQQNTYSSYPSVDQYAAYPSVQQPAYQQVYQPAFQPAYQPSYSPSSYSGYSPNLNGFFTKMQCFSGDMEVETEDGIKLIKDLKIGDKVLSMDEAFVTYSPVIMFLHKRDEELAEFNLIETSNGHSIKLTDNHLIYVSDCNAKSDLKLVAAKEVKTDDCIHVTNENNIVIKKKVSSISKVIGTGIYSPLTTTGDIIVNRVLASCHSNLALKSLQQTFFSLYKRTSSVFNSLSYFNSVQEEGHLPVGVETLTSVMDLFIPQSFV
ncbi:hypothetical protein GCK72_024105 [Caenorhabditis remanei]|uniref:Uncharacterized protein n=1 Tax=Caenorhabditis remanei TaxID=31234 RepID=A0A6A5FY96_CAERE|nr:hypothetical protein GCK72_024105 [Caenorhabditis remanei]KAF1747640.1 hypothetical protein GCK72_024105 [Caenorhabditis remanei]